MALSIDQIITASWSVVSPLFGENYHISESFQSTNSPELYRWITHPMGDRIQVVSIKWVENPTLTENAKISFVKSLLENALRSFRDFDTQNFPVIEETSDEE